MYIRIYISFMVSLIERACDVVGNAVFMRDESITI
jgi:hypothetical protein